VLPNYVRLCLTMTGKTIASRREDAINFVAAEMDALRYAVEHRDDTIKLTQEAIHAKPDNRVRPMPSTMRSSGRGRSHRALAVEQIALAAKRAGEGRQSENADRSIWPKSPMRTSASSSETRRKITCNTAYLRLFSITSHTSAAASGRRDSSPHECRSAK